MRLPARRIATTALCAGLLLGITGPAALAADGESVRERTHAASQAPLPNTDELSSQVGSLATLGTVLTPVTDLLDAVLKADNGRLPAAEADKLGAAAKEALAKVEAAGTATAPGAVQPGVNNPAQPPAVNAPAQPPAAQTPAQPPAGNAPNDDAPVTLPAPVDEAAAPGADLTAKAVADLRRQVDALVKATTTGTPQQVSPAVEKVVTGAVNVVAATLVGSGLPAPDLAGLPALPNAPESAPAS
ncbi:hypothetical protein DN402_22545 [Streptomyces sp. SW4]|nr:hypothetical protein DN402_22545 [Streptomyces sp. SW4]